MSQSMKEKVGQELARRVKNGEVLGVGTGTTVEAALMAIGERARKENLNLAVVTTSYQSAWRCEELGFRVLAPGYRGDISWGFDGADAVDPALRLIKGRGGALLKEKILAAACGAFVVIVDESKMVQDLAVQSVPVEIIPQSRSLVERELRKLGATQVTLRIGVSLERNFPVISEAGNLLLDAVFPAIGDALDRSIHAIPGVVETGLFFGFADEVLVAGNGGVRSLKA